MIHQQTLEYKTRGRGVMEIGADVNAVVRRSAIQRGICHLFVHHTSASLLLCENADPDVLHDMEEFFRRLVPDGDASFRHRAEGADDMAAHIRTVLSGASLSVPVCDAACALGTWQGIYLWEHRYAPHRRRLTVTLYGDGASSP